MILNCEWKNLEINSTQRRREASFACRTLFRLSRLPSSRFQSRMLSRTSLESTHLSRTTSAAEHGKVRKSSHAFHASRYFPISSCLSSTRHLILIQASKCILTTAPRWRKCWWCRSKRERGERRDKDDTATWNQVDFMGMQSLSLASSRSFEHTMERFFFSSHRRLSSLSRDWATLTLSLSWGKRRNDRGWRGTTSKEESWSLLILASFLFFFACSISSEYFISCLLHYHFTRRFSYDFFSFNEAIPSVLELLLASKRVSRLSSWAESSSSVWISMEIKGFRSNCIFMSFVGEQQSLQLPSTRYRASRWLPTWVRDREEHAT